MKAYLSVLLQNCVSQYTCFQSQSYFFNANSKSSIHLFKPQDDLTARDSVSTICNQSPLNFKKVFFDFKTNFRFREFIPIPIL